MRRLLHVMLLVALLTVANPVLAQGGGDGTTPSPESEQLYAMMSNFSLHVSCEALAASRMSLNMLALLTPVPEGVSIEPVAACGVPAAWFAPPDAPETPVLYYAHGGGYIIGGLDGAYRSFIARLALTTSLRVLAVDYRLAPEHPYPAAIEDSTAAYRWLAAQLPPEQIVIAGDSAGGNLAVATLLALREAGDALPAAALFSPWLDLTGSGATVETLAAADPLLDAAGLASAAGCYAGDVPLDDPMISPLFADLAGLPPVLVEVGTQEILLSDATRFTRAARLAGGDVTLNVWEGQVHVWPLLSVNLPEGEAVFTEVGAFARLHTGISE